MRPGRCQQGAILRLLTRIGGKILVRAELRGIDEDAER